MRYASRHLRALGLAVLLHYVQCATDSSASAMTTTATTPTTAASASSSLSSFSDITVSDIAASLTEIPTNSRATYPNYLASTTSSSGTTSGLLAANATLTSSRFTSRTNATASLSSSSSSEIQLSGTGTAVTSSTTAQPSSSVKCNGYSEFCDRKFSNITYVVAHNSPFHIPNNAASNQVFDVTTQLDNGIRGIQSETHYVNDTVVLCHTSCKELYAGTLEDYLVTVRKWLDNNRFEVISILLGNEDFIDPRNYSAPVTNAGLLDYLYIPPKQPMDIDDWPTLGDMIISNKRAVMMLAYDANQSQVPWLLEMWDYQWQTPFSPTDVSFPCTVQRPPGQPRDVSAKRMYLANHNLNVEIDVASLDINILVPDVVALDNTNANTTDTGAASAMIDTCTDAWGRPPNWLLVDYYNYGNFNGSVLAAAARANNVSYDVNSCCGTGAVGSSGVRLAANLWPLLAILYVVWQVW